MTNAERQFKAQCLFASTKARKVLEVLGATNVSTFLALKRESIMALRYVGHTTTTEILRRQGKVKEACYEDLMEGLGEDGIPPLIHCHICRWWDGEDQRGCCHKGLPATDNDNSATWPITSATDFCGKGEPK